jgi:hypothetical protein
MRHCDAMPFEKSVGGTIIGSRDCSGAWHRDHRQEWQRGDQA